MKLFLDDIRNSEDVYGPDQDWQVVRSYEAAIVLLYSNTVRELSLDNDLGETGSWAKEGRDVMTALAMMVIEDGYRLPIVHAHTANPVARKDIMRAYETLKIQARKRGRIVIEDADKDPSPEPEYECPVCGHVFKYGDQCEHMYFDTMTGKTEPFLKRTFSQEFRPASSRGEVCPCGAEAWRKVEEVIFDDDPDQCRHSLVQYLCLDCFNRLMRGDWYVACKEEK